jgi:hypothetical protein
MLRAEYRRFAAPGLFSGPDLFSIRTRRSAIFGRLAVGEGRDCPRATRKPVIPGLRLTAAINKLISP